MAFRIGQEVICIDDGRFAPMANESVPKKGGKYTIRGFNHGRRSGELGVLLREIVNPERQYIGGFYECCFCPKRFRPIVNTDISIFEAMLEPLPSKQQEPVEI